MPTYVDPNKCDGCRGLQRTACMYICPNDLMKYDPDLGKAFSKEHGMAFNQEPDLCWECFSCVKACPTGAITMRGYADVVPLGGSLVPMRGTDAIMWTAKYRNGQLKRFKFPIRTTSWGSIDPFKEFPTPSAAALKKQELYGEPKSLMVDQVPTPTQH
ncbi:MAG: adenylyl-sulfate reductase subunit beta [Candidatus Rokubacteria bacterium]|nr:adenylyl-sulfate reductase subunit beta [Candidatus Rokubacteria bacterium]MBI2157062.1 adenylyl-sulfate reductase subunit beta [Candidatus Rokubacteria bacterium]MBI2492590.1 adenylyl-sulfate reductase subunit beta [Candidatus Rokubacteria bacterium]